jgi:hypothetical protein
MNTDDFEQELRSQTWRELPPGWREEILAQAESPAKPAAGRSLANVQPRRASAAWWRALLWPHPLAWGGLVAAWLAAMTLGYFTSLSGPPAGTGLPVKVSGWTLRTLLAAQRRVELELQALEAPTAPAPSSPPPTPRRQSWRMVAPPLQRV